MLTGRGSPKSVTKPNGEYEPNFVRRLMYQGARYGAKLQFLLEKDTKITKISPVIELGAPPAETIHQLSTITNIIKD